MTMYWRRIRTAVSVLLWSGLLMAPNLLAQGEDGFVAAGPDDIARENLPATPLVFAAYAVAWVGVLIYVYSLWRRIGRVERELSEVMRKVEARQP
jgi:CcmD family protein